MPESLVPEEILLPMLREKPNGWSLPARTDLGWVAFKVDSIQPGREPAYPEVRHLVSALAGFFHAFSDPERLRRILEERCAKPDGESMRYRDFSVDIRLSAAEKCGCREWAEESSRAWKQLRSIHAAGP